MYDSSDDNNKDLNEIQKKQIENQKEFQEKFAQIEALAKQFMTQEAVSRYSNIKVAHPELAIKVVSMIAQAAQTNNLKEKITDDQLKRILVQIQPEKNKFRIIK